MDTETGAVGACPGGNGWGEGGGEGERGVGQSGEKETYIKLQ